MSKDSSANNPVPILNTGTNSSIMNTIKKYWSKYMSNGILDIFNNKRENMGNMGNMDNFSWNSRMYEEYNDFNNEADLMKDMNNSEPSEPSMNLEMTLDGIERLC